MIMPALPRCAARLECSSTQLDRLSVVTDGRAPATLDFPADHWPEIRQRYLILELFGAGGMGVVARALHRDLRRFVAIKFVTHTDDLRSRRQAQRLEREARILASLNHPHILKVFDHGRDGDTQYLVTELCDMTSLRARVSTGEPFAPAEAVRIASSLLEALEHVHARGIVHRDVKPDNVLFAPDGTVRLADFGLAHAPACGRRLTLKSEVPGTLIYVPPEVYAGSSHGSASDLYAVATILHELVTGQHPFRSDAVSEHIQLKLAGSPVPVRELEPRVPEGLAWIVDRALDRDPAKRFGSVWELRQALKGCRVRPAAPRRPRSVGTARSPRAMVTAPLARNGRWVHLAMSLALCAALGMIAVLKHHLGVPRGPPPVLATGPVPA